MDFPLEEKDCIDDPHFANCCESQVDAGWGEGAKLCDFSARKASLTEGIKKKIYF